MLDIFNLFTTSVKSDGQDVRKGEDQKAAVSAAEAYKTIEVAAKLLEQRPKSLERHAKYMQALLDLLAIQLRRSERAVVRACPDSSASDAVKNTRAKLEQGLEAIVHLLHWTSTAKKEAVEAGGDCRITLQALFDSPSILGAMQFCRFSATHTALTAWHSALEVHQQHHKPQQQPSDVTQQQQQQPRRPFTLVVDGYGTGHVATLQAALDMAATAAAQGAVQHYDGSKSRCNKVQSSAATGNTAAEDACGGYACATSAPASEHVLLVLLPGTYHSNCTVPGAIKHVTIAGVPGCTTILAQKGCQSEGVSQQQLQSLSTSMAQLQLMQQQAAAASGTGAACSVSGGTMQLTPHPQLGAARCLLSCPFGVESVKLQHLQLSMAGGQAAGGPAPQFWSAQLCQDSTPSTTVNNSSSSGGCSSSGNNCSAAVLGSDCEGPYCIRLSAGCELRLEWCDFSGGAGGVLSEPGAVVTAMQCSFHL